MRDSYTDLLDGLLRHRLIIPIVAVLILALGGTLFLFVGRDFFPMIDGGQIQLHVRVPAGTRIEKTEAIFQQVEDKIRDIIPAEERDLIVDNIGLPARSYNYAFGDGTATGVNDGVILVALKEDHKPTASYIKKLRQVLPAEFPQNIFYFQAADMVTQILNFSIPSQINVRTVGYNRTNNLRIAKEMQQEDRGHSRRRRRASATGDQHPRTVRHDRSRPRQPVRAHGERYRAQPEHQPVSPRCRCRRISGPIRPTERRIIWRCRPRNTGSIRLNDLKNTPVTKFAVANSTPVPGLLSNVATLKRDSIATNANQANIQPLYEIYANADGRDLGSISTDINKIVAEYKKQLTPGNRIEVIGQIESMNSAFRDLGIGIMFAAVFVYLLMVVNYQTWGDPVRGDPRALPATFCGIITMLYVTGTTLSVPSLMGAIMAIGVASANSILLVTFAREQQLAGMTAFDAAISAGRTRIRPVLMTATAMIVGMIPMAIGGAGEEQNAALARAVIGGLLFATPTTLFVVPYLFAVLRKRNDGKPARGVFAEDPQ